MCYIDVLLGLGIIMMLINVLHWCPARYQYHDIESRKSSLIGQINGILCDFRNVTSNTKIRLIKTYCMSLYGAELWDLSNSYIDSICIYWRRGVRKVWRLPNTTHSSLLPGNSNTMPLIDLLYRRFLKFVYRCLSSRSFVVNFIARHSILFCRMNSIVGRNVLSCFQRYSTNIDSVIAFRFNIENIDRIANEFILNVNWYYFCTWHVPSVWNKWWLIDYDVDQCVTMISF